LSVSDFGQFSVSELFDDMLPMNHM